MADREIAWSYGGGTQSVAIAVLIAKGLLPVPSCAVIARMDRETPQTFTYLTKHVAPMLAPTGLTIEVVEPDSGTPGLYYRETDTLPLVPAFVGEGGRSPALCSGNWKRDRIYRALRERGFGPSRPVFQWIGYSLDESQRANPKSRRLWAQPQYPLLHLVPLRREQCIRIIADAGLPPAPRSRCFDCANQRNAEWREVRDSTPELFQLAVARDREIRERDPRHAVFLHRQRVPLGEADLSDPADEPSLWEGGCNAAGCYT